MVSHFHHQTYSAERPESPHQYLSAASGPAHGSAEYQRRMADVGEAFRAAGVGAIYLVNGTFVGNDALGLFAELSRVLPTVGDTLKRVVQQAIDELTEDKGNFTGAYAREFERAINGAGEPRIPVRRFEWSGENTHLGRADGAVRLIDEIASLELPPDARVLLWGHSHGGNVFALMSHLLGASPEVAEQFFSAARVYYAWPLFGWVDVPIWKRVRHAITDDRDRFRGRPLDLVTFGTPIRYGWHTDGYSRLLHVVYHRPSAGLPAHQAPFPPSPERVLRGADGDYVQQLGIAGTNSLPSLFSWRAWYAENRLGDLLQRDLGPSGLVDRWRAGARVAESGATLLVDYDLPNERFTDHVAGHAIYTRREWLLFHAEETARRFYRSAA